MTGKRHLLGMTLDELKAVSLECGLPKFAANQIADWIYKKKICSIDEMSNISLTNRQALSVKFDIGRFDPIEYRKSEDGTIKYLFNADGGRSVESVMIPDGERFTLCVSSQVGCKMNCIFCMTGKQGFNGNLTACEILNQVFSVLESDYLTNLVFMGMGEPLDNYPEVKKSIDILTSDYGLAWSPKRITLSTTGLIPKLKLFLEETSVHLAISIHTPFPEERASIMPLEKTYPVKQVIELLQHYDWTRQRRLSFEYIMFEGLNDSLRHAEELSRLLKGLVCRVNLIRFHVIPGVNLKSSSKEKMEMFRNFLTRKGITSTIRSSRGEDIFAACGMLSTMKNKE